MDADGLERLRTSLVELGEDLQNRALEGQLRGVIIIPLEINGGIECQFAGCGLPEVLGSLQIVQTNLMRKAIQG